MEALARQESAGGSAPARPAEGFTAAASEPEQYSGATLLVTAYAAIWLLLMAWLLLLWRKQAALSARLDGLEAAIDRAAASATQTKRDKSVAQETEAEGA